MMDPVEQPPLPLHSALLALGRCLIRSFVLLAAGRIRQPRSRLGRRLIFADETSATVYRETVIDRPAPADPAVLVVEFRLRSVRHERWHKVFRVESVLNTVFFVGFDGFVSKLWLDHDEHDRYRGLYEWDG